MVCVCVQVTVIEHHCWLSAILQQRKSQADLCVCVCVCERERERRGGDGTRVCVQPTGKCIAQRFFHTLCVWVTIHL